MSMQALSQPQYGNGLMLGPDGQPLCRISHKRLRWYLDRGLAAKEGDDPLVIRLKFQPAGCGNSKDPIALLKRENVCVVCGATESLTRHHLVPHCYRKHMPDALKNNASYDVVPLCIACHTEYEGYADEPRELLAKKYDAPVHEPCLHEENKRLQSAGGAARAIKTYGNKIPAARMSLLKERVATFLGMQAMDVTAKHIDSVLDLHSQSIEYTHARKVMSSVTDMNEFVWFWRRHFMDAMKPAFLPTLWDPNRPVI